MDYCKVFVVAHKNFKVPEDGLYVPIQVGNSEDLFPKRGMRDNILFNIAEKNANYCELTAVYWIWKNVTNVMNVGICHYRRYFAHNTWNKKESNFLREKDIEKYLNEYDVIVPQKLNVVDCVKKFYYVQGEGRKKDIDQLEDIVKNKCPDYIDSYNTIMNARSAFYCNMVIMTKENFDAYCAWLFDILFALENVTDLTGYTKSEARIYGYLSEILLNVWIHKNALKIKKVPVVNTELKLSKCIKANIRNVIRGITNVF